MTCDAFTLASYGGYYATACTTLTDRQEIERRVKALDPVEQARDWRIVNGCFRDGEPNPSPCEKDASRQHWLLAC